MRKQWGKLRLRYKVLFCISSVGVAHFAISIFFWISGVVTALLLKPRMEIRWVWLLPAIISVGLFALYLFSCLLAWRSSRMAIVILLLNILITGVCFAYEASNEKWQIQKLTKEGCKHIYFNWPFYDGPN